MSARELDPLKKGLRLSFSSCKLIRIIVSSDIIVFSLLFIKDQNYFEPYYFSLGNLLSLSVFILTFKKLRLKISLSFKVSLLLNFAMNLALMLLASQLG